MSPFHLLGLVIALLLVVGILAAVAWGLGLLKPTAARWPYRRCVRLLTPAEASFFAALRAAIRSMPSSQWGKAVADEPVLIFAKVRWADLLEVDRQAVALTQSEDRGPSRRQSWQNRISQKHADFVLCDSVITQPLLVIELDDASHQRSSRIARDNFIDRACSAAGLPILHVRASRSYEPHQIARAIGDAMAAAQQFVGTSASCP